MRLYCTVVFLCDFYVNPVLVILLLPGYCKRSGLNNQGVVTEETYEETGAREMLRGRGWSWFGICLILWWQTVEVGFNWAAGFVWGDWWSMIRCLGGSGKNRENTLESKTSKWVTEMREWASLDVITAARRFNKQNNNNISKKCNI